MGLIIKERARSLSAAWQPSAVGYRPFHQLKVKRIVGKCTLAHFVTENKKQVVFGINADKKVHARLRKKMVGIGHGMW